MEYMPTIVDSSKDVNILCCDCGASIAPNPANMCVACIRSRVDITEEIPKQYTLDFCKFCERYLQHPNTWIRAALESKELLSICLKRVRGLNKVRLVDAGFIWTEPHSKRIKVKLSVQKEVFGGAVLQQVFVVEYTVNSHMCEQCQRVEAKDYWRACVQVRQIVEHKKTLYYLEQLILKYRLHLNTTGIKPVHEGIDFYYAKQQDARKLVDFIQTLLPCRYQHAQELVTHDPKNNTFDYKHSYSLELVPICKDNVVCMSKKLANSLSSISQICVCYRVTNTVQLIDPNTAQVVDLSPTVYWRDPFSSLCQPKQLTEYTVIDVETTQSAPGHRPVSTKHCLADVWVSKSSELGVTSPVCVRSHLGFLLKPGDLVKGFDLLNSNVNDRNLDTLLSKPENAPDVVLVKKVHLDRSARNRRRRWKLKHLAEDRMETSSAGDDYAEFLEDLEEDTEMRKHVNIYKDQRKLAMPVETDTEAEVPEISLQEMLDELTLTDDEMGDDEQNWEDEPGASEEGEAKMSSSSS